MNKIASRFWRALSLTSWVMASLSFVGTAGAAEEALPALSYDQTSERLLKVQANQLFESTDGGAAWTMIRLPHEVAEGRSCIDRTQLAGRRERARLHRAQARGQPPALRRSKS